jgi:hypothetical protein
MQQKSDPPRALTPDIAAVSGYLSAIENLNRRSDESLDFEFTADLTASAAHGEAIDLRSWRRELALRMSPWFSSPHGPLEVERGERYPVALTDGLVELIAHVVEPGGLVAVVVDDISRDGLDECLVVRFRTLDRGHFVLTLEWHLDG